MIQVQCPEEFLVLGLKMSTSSTISGSLTMNLQNSYQFLQPDTFSDILLKKVTT